jgi:redox-sensitive bicupin YhaK (pirin superfamily)
MSWMEARTPHCTRQRGVALLIEGHAKDLGDFSVRRLLPSEDCASVGPFVFFDHMGPADFAPGHGVNVRPHPHIGLATLTYLFEGEILHRDNLGFVQPIRPREVNLMTAGRGIVHSERTPREQLVSAHHLNGIQTWLALPESQQEIEPAFVHYDANALPVHAFEAGRATVVVGRAWGLASPVAVHSPTIYLDIECTAGASLTIPCGGDELAVYVAGGSIDIDQRTIATGTMAVVDAEVTITATQNARMIAIGGEPLGPRLLWWNFVSTSQARIDAAAQQWQAHGFAPVPDDPERIPLPAR